ncbi:MAG TPA: recombinase family protein, partial [Beijerinckiaceae bacterium]|nr:recombinase family protein [Beijerinckiaceae bacterium]
MFLSSPAVDRLSRDTTDLLMIARDLQNAGAGLKSIAEPVVDTTSDFAELVLAMLGVAAKLERRRIKERTARGRAEAKAKGVKFGRKPKLTPHQKREAIKRRDSDGETLRSIGRSYNVSAQTDREAFIMTMPPISSIAPSGNMAQQYLHRARMFFAGGLLALSVVGGASAGQFEDGIAALQRSDFAAAMRLLRPLAVKQNAGAQFNLGWMYANGKGVLQDFKEAA